MKAKRTYLFLLDKESGKPDAKLRFLRFRVKWGSSKNIVSFNVGYRVDADKWSFEAQRCKSNTTHGKKKIPANVINKEIQRYEGIADSIFDSCELRLHVPEVDEFRAEFNRLSGKLKAAGRGGGDGGEKGFFEVFDEFTATVGFSNSWTAATFTKFRAIKAHLLAFDEKLSFDKMSEQTMHQLTHYQLSVPLRNTTIAKNIAFVKWFLRWAHGKGYYAGNVHETFKARLKGVDGNSREVIHLTWDELQRLYSYPIPDSKQYLARVRDVFCFCCFTSLRYSDVAKLRRSDVKETHISVVTQKTADGLTIELNDYSREILAKYADFSFENDMALPVISNPKMNAYLKELGEMAGLNEPQRIVYFIGSSRHEEVYPKYALLTTHCGRRTFVVNALYLGIPAEVVMRWTGHSDYKAMKPYIKIVDVLKDQEMRKFNRK
jgi:integrase